MHICHYQSSYIILAVIFSMAYNIRRNLFRKHIWNSQRMPHLKGITQNIQTTDWGWPGGRNGNALASTTLSPSIPSTLARLSSTAIGSDRTPILHVQAACHRPMVVSRMTSSISLSVWYISPGKYSSPTIMGAMALLRKMSRALLSDASATCWSVSVASKLRLTTGRSFVSAEMIEMFPREVGIIRVAMMLAYCFPSFGCIVMGSAKLPTKSGAAIY
jgi:hypothetical protein